MGLRDAWKAQEDRSRSLKLRAEQLKADKQKRKSDPEYATKQKKDKLGLDFESYTDEQLASKNEANIDMLSYNPATKVDMDLATTLAGATTRDLYAAVRGLIEQNWIIIRQNEQIVRELKKSSNNPKR